MCAPKASLAQLGEHAASLEERLTPTLKRALKLANPTSLCFRQVRKGGSSSVLYGNPIFVFEPFD
jgi:hypothetical protein